MRHNDTLLTRLSTTNRPTWFATKHTYIDLLPFFFLSFYSNSKHKHRHRLFFLPSLSSTPCLGGLSLFFPSRFCCPVVQINWPIRRERLDKVSFWVIVTWTCSTFSQGLGTPSTLHIHSPWHKHSPLAINHVDHHELNTRATLRGEMRLIQRTARATDKLSSKTAITSIFFEWQTQPPISFSFTVRPTLPSSTLIGMPWQRCLSHHRRYTHKITKINWESPKKTYFRRLGASVLKRQVVLIELDGHVYFWTTVTPLTSLIFIHRKNWRKENWALCGVDGGRDYAFGRYVITISFCTFLFDLLLCALLLFGLFFCLLRSLYLSGGRKLRAFTAIDVRMN